MIYSMQRLSQILTLGFLAGSTSMVCLAKPILAQTTDRDLADPQTSPDANDASKGITSSAIAPDRLTVPRFSSLTSETGKTVVDIQPNFAQSSSMAISVQQSLTQSSEVENDIQPSFAQSSPTAISVQPSLTQSSEVENDIQPSFAQTDEVNSASEQSIEIAQANVDNEIQILNPASDSVIDIPATTVIVQFSVGTQVELRINNQLVDASLIGQTETNPETNQVTQIWYGVPLDGGQNTITVHAAGSSTPIATSTVTVTGSPTALEIAPLEASVPANGRAIATVRGEFLDETGNRSNWNALVTLESSQGSFLGTDFATDQPGFQVQAQNGQFLVELQAPLEAGTGQVVARSGNLEAYTRLPFVTPQRPSIATGFVDLRFGARGTDYYSSYRDFLPLDGNNSYEFDVDAAVFARGNLGEWLFTGAYNSDRSLNEDCRGGSALFRQAAGSCSQPYDLYGDDSSRDVVTPSLDSLYLRFERTSPVDNSAIDYVQWGDYNTQEFATTSQLFSSVSRELHGFKLNYNLGNLAITGLYGDNIEGFQRDTLAPNGTSGLYFLSRRLIIPGTEIIVLEVSELDRPGTVVDRQELFRGQDYTIDYDRGTVLFDDALNQTTVDRFGNILVRQIVATYQFESQDSTTDIWAGRLQYNLNRTLGQESWLGTTFLQENQGTRNFTLWGADARIALGSDAQLIAEVAHSANDFDISGPISGTAYRLEADGIVNDWLAGRAYFRSTDAGFSNAATTSFVPGQTRYGASADVQVSDRTTVRAQFDHEDNFGTAPRVLTNPADFLTPGVDPVPGSPVNNSLSTFSLGVAQQFGNSDLEFDWIHRSRTDRTNSGILNATSDQLRTRLTSQLSDTVTFRAQNELNLSSESDPLFPSRTLFGLDWEVMPGITLGVNQIFYGGNINDRNSITTIDLQGEHNLSEDTTIRGRFSSIEGQNLGGAIGIEHGFNLAPGLRLDLGYERTFNTTLGSTAAGSTFTQPFAVGTGASGLTTTSGDSYSIGLSYTDNADLQAHARLEHHSSSTGSNTVFDAAAEGRLSPALSVLMNYQLTGVANPNVSNLGTSSHLKLGLAYRDPNDDRWNALLRYEHRLNPVSIPTNQLFGSGINTAEHVFSAEAIYAPNWQWEFFAKYAFRHSSTSIARPADVGGTFSSSSSLHLAQLRATHRFNYSWDAVAEARWILGPGSYQETGFALEAGYYPTPDLRLYAGYSLGGAHDIDFGTNRSSGGFYLGVAAKVNSLFDGFGLQDIVPVQQQESILEAREPETNVEEEEAQ